ncbi:MAG: hypothetical protein GF311_13415 [Candidatus Lokiarchaeota archaeon]|nr:hypothetical protein [Candidatus Lokiarchaeota archaeon]
MVRNPDNKKEEYKDNIISKIMQEKKYEINLIGYDEKDGRKTIDSVVWTGDWGHDIIYKFFLIFQEELSFISTIRRYQDLYSFICKFLYNEFYNDIKKKNELKIENTLEKKIEELEEYQFFTSKGFGKNYETIADEYEKISLEEVKDMILSLRKQRISVYKEILDEYKNNKEKYLNYLNQ